MEKRQLVRTFGSALAAATLSFGLFAAPAIADPSFTVSKETIAVVDGSNLTYKEYDAKKESDNQSVQLSAKIDEKQFEDFDAKGTNFTATITATNESLKVEQEFPGTITFIGVDGTQITSTNLDAIRKTNIDEVRVTFKPGADALNGEWTLGKLKLSEVDQYGEKIECEAPVSGSFSVINGKKEVDGFPQLREETVSATPKKVNAKINQSAILTFDVYDRYGADKKDYEYPTVEVVYTNPAGKDITIDDSSQFDAKKKDGAKDNTGTDNEGVVWTYTVKGLPNSVDGSYTLKSIKIVWTDVNKLTTSKTWTSNLWDGDYEVVSSGVAAIYRAYNPWDGQHLYTTSTEEYLDAVLAGWTGEGLAWYAPINELSAKTLQPVYRVYNEFNGEHHFTTSKNEAASLILLGWTDEGVAFYTAQQEGDGNVPVYRLFNQYATVGTHHYTTDKGEYDELVKLGWTGEKIGWYAVKDAE